MAAKNVNKVPTKTIRAALMLGLLKTADFILKLVSPAVLFHSSTRREGWNRPEPPAQA
jgi:hypothetical protein